MEKLCPGEDSRKLFELICGRAEISRENGLIYDPKAEEIAAALRAQGESAKQGKYLSLYLGIRALYRKAPGLHGAAPRLRSRLALSAP